MNLFKYEYIMLYYKFTRAVRSHMDIGPVQLRSYLERLSHFTPAPRGVKTSKETIGEIKCDRITYKGESNETIILYLHGGAFAFGSSKTHRALMGHLARLTKCEILAPNYRLTPEFKYPAGLDDCEKVYTRMLEMYPNKKIIVMGDSAGGNLSCALTERCISKNIQLPSKLALMSPWLDLRINSESAKLNQAADSVFNQKDLRSYADLYADGTEMETPEISPLQSKNLSSYPPVLLQVATNELLFPDSEIFAKKLQEAQVNVRFQASDKLFHSWQVFPDYVSEAMKSLEEIAEFVKQPVQ
jgi:monoterpene epsilon-lactone hydrolase